MGKTDRLVSTSPGRTAGIRTIGLIALYVAALAAVALLALYSVRAWSKEGNDTGRGIPPRIPLAAVYPWGANVELGRYSYDGELEYALSALSRAGLQWVRQPFRWADLEPSPNTFDWTQADRWVEATRDHNLKLIALLDTAPRWARAPEDADDPFAPPVHYEDFGAFAAAFAERYGADIAAYQIWDEPNIAPHWGHRYVDPVAYSFLLRTAAREIRAVDPKAVIVTAALAPTTEIGGANMNEILYLRKMYGVGAARYFDVLAAEPYGFRTGPEDRRVSANVLNFSRVLLLREEMKDWGDGDKAIWATTFGWNALPPDWSGRPSIWGATTPDEQARRTLLAVARAQSEWPWMGAMLLPAFQPDAPPGDPRWGFALLSSNGTPSPLYRSLVKESSKPWVPGPGWYPAEVPLSPATVGAEKPALSFRGTRLDAVLWGPVRAHIAVDGNEQPREVVVTGLGRQRVTLVRGLADSPHRAVITVSRAGPQARLEEIIVLRERATRPYALWLAALSLVAVLIGSSLWRSLQRIEPPQEWQAAVQRGSAGHEWIFLATMGGAITLFYLASTWPLIGLGALLAGILYLLRPEIGLTLTALSIPFFLLPKVFPGGKQFSLVEILTLVGLSSWVLRQALPSGWWGEAVTARRRPNALDVAVAAFVVLGLLSLSWSTNFGTAARQFRVVVLEPAIFYGLVRAYVVRRREMLRLLDALVVAGIALALHALWQAATGNGVIVAEGVSRVRSLYGSPNNLSLFLGRVLPVAVAVALYAPASRRRWLYGLATLPLVAALFLTFSRGAWFLGLPAAFALLAWHGGKRIRASFTAIALAGFLALLPFFRTERLASLLNLHEGTSFLRINLWVSAAQMIRDHPLQGIGLDNFLYLYPRYIQPAAWGEPALSHPHNVLLHFWVALGILGLALFLWQQTLFWRNIRKTLPAASRWNRVLLLALAASMADFLAHGTIDNSYFLVDLAFVYMLTIALLNQLGDEQKDD
ncbi:MAG: hypothetical protein GXP41_00015 [Chloroflexi bacterium]|nr:hypothetical protein [Chloroflexota bacterium]